MTRELFIDRLRDRRVGLVLSSGFFGFFHHTGVLAGLTAAGIHPVRLAGNSAGALIGGLYASGLAPEAIRDVLLNLERRDFWDVHFPFGRGGFSLLAGHRYRAALGRYLQTHTFESCRIPLTVGVYDTDTGRMAYLDKGPLIPAVYASSAVPYLFQPETIGGRRYWDGGFAEKTPLVPFLAHDDVDVILVSYLPQRGSGEEKQGIRRFVPPLSALFANVPYDERCARDKASLAALETAGREVLFLKPRNLAVGPFSLDRAGAAYERGFDGAAALLSSSVDNASPPW